MSGRSLAGTGKRFFLLGLVSAIAVVLALGCAGPSELAGKRPPEMIAAADAALKEAADLDAQRLAAKKYEKAEAMLDAARKADESGNARKAAKKAEKAYVLGRKIAAACRLRGEGSVAIRLDRPAGPIHYRYIPLGRHNHVLLIFDSRPKIEKVETLGPLEDAKAEGAAVDLTLLRHMCVREIKRNGGEIEIVAVRRRTFWPIVVCVLADTGVAFHMNRGDPFHAIDVLRFFPYLAYIPRIIDAVKVGKGSVGVVPKNDKTGFEKVGNLGSAAKRITVRCRLPQ